MWISTAALNACETGTKVTGSMVCLRLRTLVPVVCDAQGSRGCRFDELELLEGPLVLEDSALRQEHAHSGGGCRAVIGPADVLRVTLNQRSHGRAHGPCIAHMVVGVGVRCGVTDQVDGAGQGGVPGVADRLVDGSLCARHQ